MWLQDGRICTLDTPLGKDALVVRRLRGREAVSEPFRFEMELISQNQRLDLRQLIGKRVTVRVDLPDGAGRHLNAIVTRFGHVGTERSHALYRMEVRPWLWLLSRRTDCRIFQDVSVPEILQKVFRHHGFQDFEFRLNGKYRSRVNCVQYRESDLAFVMRLLEDEGIHFYFEHNADRHMLILADNQSQVVPCPHQPTAKYDAVAGGNRTEDTIESLIIAESLVSGRDALADFNFLDPKNSLLVDAPDGRSGGAFDKCEVYDYPGQFVGLGAEDDGKLDIGDQRVRLRAQEGDARSSVAEGVGGCRAFEAGRRVDLEEHPRADFNQPWFLVSVEHELLQAGGWGSGDPDSSQYRNQFTCMPHSVLFRPARLTPIPTVSGPQTAIVTGPEGEEIYVDRHGRIKVQFPWDREGRMNENSSCWIRVAQPLAGKQWGMQFNPRIGQEVVVEFLEGDPDRPLVTGRVYNAENPIPYGTATQGGVKTRSSKQGGPANCNEIRFEDRRGAEEFYIQAEKDLNQVVKNCRTESIGANQSESVGGSKSISVKQDHTEAIGGSATISVAVDESVSVGGRLSLMVGQDSDCVVGANLTEKIGSNQSATIGGVKTETVSLASLETVGAAKTLTVGAAYAVTVAGAMNVAVGLAQFEQVGLTKKIVVGDSLEITCGDSKLTMDSGGAISISGASITIAGSENLLLQAPKINIMGGSNVKVEAEMIDLN